MFWPAGAPVIFKGDRNLTGRQTKSTKRIAGKAAQQTENQQLTAERQILARKTKCDLLGLCCDLTALNGSGTWI